MSKRMSNNTTDPTSDSDTAPDNQSAHNGPDATDTRADEAMTITVGEFERLTKDLTEWKERCMRSQAEFENVRRRLRKEADEAGTRAVARASRTGLRAGRAPRGGRRGRRTES